MKCSQAENWGNWGEVEGRGEGLSPLHPPCTHGWFPCCSPNPGMLIPRAPPPVKGTPVSPPPQTLVSGDVWPVPQHLEFSRDVTCEGGLGDMGVTAGVRVDGWRSQQRGDRSGTGTICCPCPPHTIPGAGGASRTLGRQICCWTPQGGVSPGGWGSPGCEMERPVGICRDWGAQAVPPPPGSSHDPLGQQGHCQSHGARWSPQPHSLSPWDPRAW